MENYEIAHHIEQAARHIKMGCENLRDASGGLGSQNTLHNVALARDRFQKAADELKDIPPLNGL